MATFGERIQANVGSNFPLSTGGNAFGSVKLSTLADQWIADGIKEVINVLSQYDPYEFGAITPAALANYTNGTGVDITTKVISVVRAESTAFSDGQVHTCREIPEIIQYEAKDPDSIHYATPQDPVYFLEAQTSSASVKLHVLPTSTVPVAKATYISYPSATIDSESITNFPDAHESLVVSYASIRTAEHLLADEEDIEIYAPIITNLKQSYQESLGMALSSYGVKPPQPQQQRG